METKNERIPVWDNIKFFLILLVVAGHLADSGTGSSRFDQSVFIAIYAFHMPLFVFISGLFYDQRRLREKVIGYIALSYILKMALFAIDAVAYGKTTMEFFSIYNVPWFLFAIAVFSLFNYLLRDAKTAVVLIMAFLIALFIGYDPNISDFLAISRIVVFYPFYFLGSRISRVALEHLLENKVLKIAGCLIVLAWIVCCFTMTDKIYYLRPLFTGRNPYNDLFYGIGFVYRALTYIISTIVGLAFMFMMPTRHIKLISYCGQHSFRAYYWHIIILNISIALGCYSSFFSASAIGKVSWILISIPLSIVCCALKVFDYPKKWLIK